jgi:hypothetical protein
VTFRDKYVEITTHLLLGDAGKLKSESLAWNLTLGKTRRDTRKRE